jgi:serine phosphatase RsbU (regulator of sigma subunit)
MKGYTQEIEAFKSLILQGSRIQSDFLTYDLIDNRFFLNEGSENLFLFEQLGAVEVEKVKELRSHPVAKKGDILQRLDSIDLMTKKIRRDFNELVQSALITGFEDFGTTGEMREYAHRLEDEFNHLIPTSDLLMLRRHEKDFIIRKKDKYRRKFNNLYFSIKASLEDKTAPGILDCLLTLQRYHETFNEMYLLHLKNGINTKGGLRGEVSKTTRLLLSETDAILLEVEKISAPELRNLKRLFYLSIALSTIVTIWVVIYLSRVMSRSIRTLSGGVHQFVVSNFEDDFKSDHFEKRKDELGALYRNFQKLSEEVTVHFKNYRMNAEAKHREITEKNDQIVKQKAQLEAQRNLLSRRNQSLMDSILYARRIQSALLPNIQRLKSMIGEHTLVFKPKDIVSGDFYWVEQTADSLYFAVADCTGHGVPGAFMSILGYNHLNQAIRESGLKEPGAILNYLNENISKLLNRENLEDGVKDGMDIILCRWIFSEKILEYAGANRPLLVTSEGESTTYATDRLAIGWMYGNTALPPFHTFRLRLKMNETIFLFTDGFSDQFGGDDNKKLKPRNFKKLLSEASKGSAQNCRMQLIRSFREWKGNNEQVDDVCVLGVKAAELYALPMNAESKVKFISGEAYPSSSFGNS